MTTCKRKSTEGLCKCRPGSSYLEVQPIMKIFSLLNKSGIDTKIIENTIKNIIGISKSTSIPDCDGLKNIGKDVERIKMVGVGIEKLENMEQFPNLIKLEAGGNKITGVDASKLPATLEKLDLRWNPLEKIENIENLPDLEVLKLTGTNPITGIDGITKLQYIEEVDLTGRPGIVPPGRMIGDIKVGSMAKRVKGGDLIVLKAALRNEKSSMQDIAGAPENICDIHYHDDVGLLVNDLDLTDVPECATVNAPERIVLSNNNIKTAKTLTGKSMSWLKKLYLDGNKLKKMARMNAPELEILDLSNNQIEEIENLNYPELKELRLRGNKIETIGSFNGDIYWDVFKSSGNIKRLDLSKNNITTRQGLATITTLPKLESLDLSGNPLKRIRCTIKNKTENISLRKELGKKEIKKLKKCL